MITYRIVDVCVLRTKIIIHVVLRVVRGGSVISSLVLSSDCFLVQRE